MVVNEKYFRTVSCKVKPFDKVKIMNSENYKKTEYNNPFIMQRADPYICKDGDKKYYFTASVPQYDKIILRCADSIESLRNADEKEIWHKHKAGIMSKHIWAPEMHKINNEWYIYYAAGEKDDVWKIRPYVIKCAGEDPMKDVWVELGPMIGADSFSFQDFSLDMTVFSCKEKWYAIWAEKVSVGKKISNLYIAEMETPNKLKSSYVLLTTPSYDWERIDFWVNEGPAVLKHDGKIFVTFSASATGECYCIGLLSIDEDAEILDPCAWKKERYPVLKTDAEKGMFGPGHNCFVKDEYGTEDIMIYHARMYDEIKGDPLYDVNRHTYRMYVKWREDNRPIFDYANNF